MDILLLALRIGLAVVLYGFLAAVCVLLALDLGHRQDHRMREFPVGRLVIIETESEGIEVGTSYTLQPVTSLGRSPGNTVAIPDPYASGSHSLLSWREGQWWLEDQDSRNGTFLNGEPLGALAVVSSGDIIGIGRTQLRMELQ